MCTRIVFKIGEMACAVPKKNREKPPRPIRAEAEVLPCMPSLSPRVPYYRPKRGFQAAYPCRAGKATEEGGERW